MDTKGNVVASLANIYEHARILRQLGYDAQILHEKSDYMSVVPILGDEYSDIPHVSADNQQLKVSSQDFIIIPEIFANVMEQTAKLPSKRIVFLQSYDYIFETLQPGQTWTQLGFHKCITTSEKQKEYISSTMRSVSVDVIEPTISEVFEKQKFPPKTIIGVHTRDHRDTVNLIKTFYTKFPQYRWITFRDLRGLSQVEFTNAMKESFASVWIDNISSFGTFPLESMKMGIPVIGLVPNITPEWMNEENGIWINNQNMIVDVIADFIQNWLEDNLNPKLYEEMDVTINKLSTKEKFESEVDISTPLLTWFAKLGSSFHTSNLTFNPSKS